MAQKKWAIILILTAAILMTLAAYRNPELFKEKIAYPVLALSIVALPLISRPPSSPRGWTGPGESPAPQTDPTLYAKYFFV